MSTGRGIVVRIRVCVLLIILEQSDFFYSVAWIGNAPCLDKSRIFKRCSQILEFNLFLLILKDQDNFLQLSHLPCEKKFFSVDLSTIFTIHFIFMIRLLPSPIWVNLSSFILFFSFHHLIPTYAPSNSFSIRMAIKIIASTANIICTHNGRSLICFLRLRFAWPTGV